MITMRIVTSFAAVILPSTASADWDPVSGMVTNDVATTPYTALPHRAGGTEVLWDISHGASGDYAPHRGFAELIALLDSFNFTTTNAGIDNIDLSPYDILVICVANAYESAYTLNEVLVAQAFVAGGGGVLILGDNPHAWPENINPIAQTLGASTGNASLQPLDLYFSNLSSHPIFNGIDTLYFRAGGSLQTSGVMTPVAWTDPGDQVTVAVSESPCVIVTGDVNMFRGPERINLADNRDFAVNVFNWLESCGPVSVDPSSWGSIRATYR